MISKVSRLGVLDRVPEHGFQGARGRLCQHRIQIDPAGKPQAPIPCSSQGRLCLPLVFEVRVQGFPPPFGFCKSKSRQTLQSHLNSCTEPVVGSKENDVSSERWCCNAPRIWQQSFGRCLRRSSILHYPATSPFCVNEPAVLPVRALKVRRSPGRANAANR